MGLKDTLSSLVLSGILSINMYLPATLSSVAQRAMGGKNYKYLLLLLLLSGHDSSMHNRKIR